MKFTIHAGHNPDGKPGSGAIGILKESTCAREVVQEVMLLDVENKLFTDITVNDGLSASGVLNTLIADANSINADINLSVHLNASNGKGNGTEAYVYSENTLTENFAASLVNNVCAEIGTVNRGVKNGSNLAFIRRTKNRSILLECCFCDSEVDCAKFDSKAIASAIYAWALDVAGIKKTEIAGSEEKIEKGGDNKLYRVQIGAYASRENAERMLKNVQNAGFTAIIRED